MEITGLAISVVSLAAIFDACVKSYDLIENGRSFSRDYEVLGCRLEAQQLILLQWGESVGLGEDGRNSIGKLFLPERHGRMMKRLLSNILMIFEDAERLQTKYGLKTPTSSRLESLQNTRDASVVPSPDDRMQEKGRLRWFQKRASFRSKAIWAISDKAKFKDLLNELKILIDQLRDITANLRHNSNQFLVSSVGTGDTMLRRRSIVYSRAELDCAAPLMYNLCPRERLAEVGSSARRRDASFDSAEGKAFVTPSSYDHGRSYWIPAVAVDVIQQSTESQWQERAMEGEIEDYHTDLQWQKQALEGEINSETNIETLGIIQEALLEEDSHLSDVASQRIALLSNCLGSSRALSPAPTSSTYYTASSSRINRSIVERTYKSFDLQAPETQEVAVTQLCLTGTTYDLVQALENVSEHSRNPLCNQLLLDTVRHRRLDFLEILIAHDVDLNEIDTDNLNALHLTATNGFVDIATKLLESGAEINLRVPNYYSQNFGQGWCSGRTALHFAVAAGESDMVLKLLEYHADINVLDGYGNTPLHNAMQNHKEGIKLVRSLTDRGANANIKFYDGKTDLQLAVSSRDSAFEVAATLLTHGANVNTKNSIGETALHCAVSSLDLRASLLLLNNKADVDAHDMKMGTPLHSLLLSLEYEVTEFHADSSEISRYDHYWRSQSVNAPQNTPELVMLGIDRDLAKADMILLLVAYDANCAYDTSTTGNGSLSPQSDSGLARLMVVSRELKVAVGNLQGHMLQYSREQRQAMMSTKFAGQIDDRATRKRSHSTAEA